MGGRRSAGSTNTAGFKPTRVAAAEKLGATVWEKGANKRLYFNTAAEKIIGLEYSRYKSGNISSATLKGEVISNSEARRYLAAIDGTYADLKTGEIHTGWRYGRRESGYDAEIKDALKKYMRRRK